MFSRQWNCAPPAPSPPAAPGHAGAAGNFPGAAAGRGCAPPPRQSFCPIFLLVTTPSRGFAPAGSLCQLAIRQPSASRSPACRTRAKSRPCARRDARPRRRRPASGVRGLRSGDGAGMTRGVLKRREAFAARATAAGKRGTAAPAGLAGQKPVLPFAAGFRRLILAFHKFLKFVSGAKTGACEHSNKTSRVKAPLTACSLPI
jgi:hypothetical protein